jgi:hypothetical protein
VNSFRESLRDAYSPSESSTSTNRPATGYPQAVASSKSSDAFADRPARRNAILRPA